jgi:RHS repeat-associated protein
LNNQKLKYNYHLPEVLLFSNYNPFGMPMPGRKSGSQPYRFSFQGQEKDDEIKGQGNSLNYEYRMHDPRIGRFFAVDPLAVKYPYNSTYAFSENRVIDGVELEGLERYYSPEGKNLGKITPIMEGVSEDDLRVISEENWNRIHKEQGGKSFSTDINGKSVNITLSYFLNQESKDIRETNNSAMILESIFNSSTGYKLADNNIQYGYTDGTTPAWWIDNNSTITINSSLSYSKHYFTLLNMMVKEGTHMTDYHLQAAKPSDGNNVRELNGYVNAANHASFSNVDEKYRHTFITGAGKFLYELKVQAMDSEFYGRKEDSKYFYGEFNKYLSGLESAGIKFDFTGLDAYYDNIAKNGRTLDVIVTSESVKYKYKR